jgi:protein phosphatase
MLMFDGIDVDIEGLTDRGRVRRENQDQYLIAALHKTIEIHGTSIPQAYQERFNTGAKALLLLVADGVGGRAGGEEAASITLDAITDYVTNSMRCFYKLDEQIPQELLGELAATVARSHSSVLQRAEERPERAGMATTLTMAHVLWPRVYVVQIGDSRCYHVRGPAIKQITKDQTLVQELVDLGALSPDDARRSPLSNILSQAIGGGEELQPAISKIAMEPGDGLVLCTDGLTGHVSDAQILAHLQAAESSQNACQRLVQAALEDGGRDNVTVIVGRFS